MTTEIKENEKILFTVKQKIQCEITSIVTVLLLPLSMIFLANSKTGVIVGISFLVIILYGIYNIYTILYQKELTITSQRIIYKHFKNIEILDYETLSNIEIKRSFFNTLCNTATLILTVKSKDISLVNVENTEAIKEFLKNKMKG